MQSTNVSAGTFCPFIKSWIAKHPDYADLDPGYGSIETLHGTLWRAGLPKTMTEEQAA